MTKVNLSGLGVMTAKFQYIVNGISVVNSFDYLRESYGSLDNLSARKRSDVSKEFILHKYEVSKAIARM